MENHQTHIAYIISMRNGIHHFIYTEIKILIKNGLNITIFPVKYGKGIYMPEDAWDIYIYNPFRIILHSLLYFINNPLKTAFLISEAIKTKSLIDLIFAFDFSHSMKNKRVTKIHCHFGDHRLFIGYYCKKILKIPLSVTIHAYELYENPNPIMFLRSIKSCDDIIAISQYNKEILSSKFEIDKTKISVIRLFVENKNIRNDSINILIVGRYVLKKGHDILFKAIKLLKRDDIKVWVAGIGDDSKIRKIAVELKIEDKIVFFGTVSDKVLNLLYLYCDIFCLPSREDKDGNKEGIPVALMEAMSYGKPVISTKHAGIPELVKEVLVEENNAEELAREIEKLANNIELRKDLGKINREIIERQYSENNLLQLKSIFIGDNYEVHEEN